MSLETPQTETLHLALGGTIDADHWKTKKTWYDKAQDWVSQITIPQAEELRTARYLREQYGARVSSIDIARKDSKDITFADLSRVAQLIRNAMETGVQRVVITEGTDAVASLVEFLPQMVGRPLTIPVVIVVAMTPLSVEDPGVALPPGHVQEWPYPEKSDGYMNLAKASTTPLEPGYWLSTNELLAPAHLVRKNFRKGIFELHKAKVKSLMGKMPKGLSGPLLDRTVQASLPTLTI